jgi:hypothetical protein
VPSGPQVSFKCPSSPQVSIEISLSDCHLSLKISCTPFHPLSSMVKEASPPPMKTEHPPRGDDLSTLLSQADNNMSNEDTAASDNLGKFLAAIPSASRSQFLAAISSKEFLKSFTAIASDDSKPPQVKFEHGNNDYAAFAAKQAKTLKEEYEHYKS